MKRSRAFLIPLLILALIGCNPQAHSSTDRQVFQPAGWRVFFSPQGGATQAVVSSLNQARISILVQAYSFTSSPIAEALVSAHNRGLKVEVILDKSQVHTKNGKAQFLAQSRIPVYIDAAHSIAHNKVMVIDNSKVITGSFNFTVAAELYNAENLLIISDKDLTAQYTANWNKHRQHSQPYDNWKIADAMKHPRKNL